MCRVTEPELQNLVVHFRALGEAGEVLVPLRRPPSRGSRPGGGNFYVLLRPPPPQRLGGGGGDLRPRRRRRRRRRRRLPEEEEEEEEETALSFTVFPSTGSVIASGLRARAEILPVLTDFAREVCELRGGGEARAAAGRWGERVVNSTHAGSIECESRGTSACRAVALSRRGRRGDKSAARVSLRSQFFPSSLVRWSDCRGTVSVFNNGRYVIVGSREEEETREVYLRLCALIRANWTTTDRATSCAWSADWCSIA